MTISDFIGETLFNNSTLQLQYISRVKQVAALFLLFLFLFQLGGWIMPFYIHQQGIRHSIKQRIKKGVPEGELIYFEENDDFLAAIEWENDHEFRLDGAMYDVVKTETSSNKKVFACINDRQEEQLFAQLDELVNNELNKEANVQRLKKNQRVWHFFNEEASEVHIASPIHPRYSMLKASNYQSPRQVPLSPPPESLASM